MRDEGDVIKDLRAEMSATQQRRADYVRQKFLFVVSLLGIGGISLSGKVDTLWALYLAPFVAFSFDLYIYGEDFGVKRVGAFLSQESSNAPVIERKWEKFVNQNRDPLRKFAGLILSLLVLLGSAVPLFFAERTSFVYWIAYWLWVLANGVAILGLSVVYRHRFKLLEEKSDLAGSQPPSS